MKSSFLIALILVLVGCITACDKQEKEEEFITSPQAALLTAKAWRISAETSTQTTNGQTITIDQYAATTPCQKDDFIRFNTDKSADFDQGSEKCASTSAEPQVGKGSWKLTDGQTKLVVTQLTGIEVPATIVELTESVLRVQLTANRNGTTYVQSTTYTGL